MTYAQLSWPLTSEGSVTRDILYNGYLRGPVILTPIAERLAVDLSLPLFLRLRSVAARIRTSNHRLRGQRSHPLRHRRGNFRFRLVFCNIIINIYKILTIVALFILKNPFIPAIEGEDH